MISSAGFINRVDTAIKTPIGGWAPDPKLRDLGFWALLGFDLGLEGYAMATLTRVLGVCCSCYSKTPMEQQMADQLRVVDSDRSTRLTVRLSTRFLLIHPCHILSCTNISRAQVRRAAKDRRIHKYHDVKVVYAQKPFPPDSTETHRNTPPR
jgi:hypothetical protein